MSLLRILVIAAITINSTGVLGLGWLVAGMLAHDVGMVIELSTCVTLMALLAVIVAGGLALNRRGRPRSAIVLLTVGALPTLLVYGLLAYLEHNPIDWR